MIFQLYMHNSKIKDLLELLGTLRPLSPADCTREFNVCYSLVMLMQIDY